MGQNIEGRVLEVRIQLGAEALGGFVILLFSWNWYRGAGDYSREGSLATRALRSGVSVPTNMSITLQVFPLRSAATDLWMYVLS